jgi:hypothetical protein
MDSLELAPVAASLAMNEAAHRMIDIMRHEACGKAAIGRSHGLW